MKNYFSQHVPYIHTIYTQKINEFNQYKLIAPAEMIDISDKANNHVFAISTYFLNKQSNYHFHHISYLEKAEKPFFISNNLNFDDHQ